MCIHPSHPSFCAVNFVLLQADQILPTFPVPHKRMIWPAISTTDGFRFRNSTVRWSSSLVAICEPNDCHVFSNISFKTRKTLQRIIFHLPSTHYFCLQYFYTELSPTHIHKPFSNLLRNWLYCPYRFRLKTTTFFRKLDILKVCTMFYAG